MSDLDRAVSTILDRMRTDGRSIQALSDESGVGVATIWALRSTDSVEDANATLKTLRRLEAALARLEAGTSNSQAGSVHV